MDARSPTPRPIPLSPLEALREALRLLWAHKLRAALTLFGLVWGTAAVILLVGWGDGVIRMVEDGFWRSGRNLVQLWPGRIGEDFTPAVDRRTLWFTRDDLAVLRRRARLPELVGGEARNWVPATHRQRSINTELRGVEPESQTIRGVRAAAGRLITRSDLGGRAQVAVLGHDTRRRLLGADGGVGSSIRLEGKRFRVVGVLDRVGTQLSRDGDPIDEQIWIPLTTSTLLWPSDLTEEPVVQTILMRLRSRALHDETVAEARSILAERLGVSPFDEEAINSFSPVQMLRTLPLDQQKGLMLLLSATTLLVGGIGTLNMMIDAVQERRSEIGVRLAVGARRRDIVAQFFLETLCVVAIGGLTGVALGVAGCLALGSLDMPDLVPVPVLSWEIIAIALGVMSVVGLVAGVVPAWRAARVDPALTLREE